MVKHCLAWVNLWAHSLRLPKQPGNGNKTHMCDSDKNLQEKISSGGKIIFRESVPFPSLQVNDSKINITMQEGSHVMVSGVFSV